MIICMNENVTDGWDSEVKTALLTFYLLSQSEVGTQEILNSYDIIAGSNTVLPEILLLILYCLKSWR